ncbi:hypothetical protein [Streptomyces phaeochromogenes]
MSELRDVNNDMGGHVVGHVVQAGAIHGDVVVHGTSTSRSEPENTCRQFIAAAEDFEHAVRQVLAAHVAYRNWNRDYRTNPNTKPPWERSADLREAQSRLGDTVPVLGRALRRVTLTGRPTVIEAAVRVLSNAEDYCELLISGVIVNSSVKRCAVPFEESLQDFAIEAGKAYKSETS